MDNLQGNQALGTWAKEPRCKEEQDQGQGQKQERQGCLRVAAALQSGKAWWNLTQGCGAGRVHTEAQAAGVRGGVTGRARLLRGLSLSPVL